MPVQCIITWLIVVWTQPSSSFFPLYFMHNNETVTYHSHHLQDLEMPPFFIFRRLGITENHHPCIIPLKTNSWRNFSGNPVTLQNAI